MTEKQSVKLSYLTLFPIPLPLIPSVTSPEYSVFRDALVNEAHQLLDHPQWSTPPRSWFNGLVETYSLPHGSTTHVPADLHGAGAVEGAQPAAPEKKSGGGFWGTGGGKKKEEDSVDKGIAWHMRTSVLGESTKSVHKDVGYEVFWEALGERHCEQELEYIPTLGNIVHTDNSCILKLYNLPFPTTNRAFYIHLLVLPTTPAATESDPHPLRSFLVFSVPVKDPANKAIKEEKGHVRGLYVAVEEVKEIRNEATGDVEIVWRCASQSSPGGSIPTRLAESHMPSSLASHIPAFFEWMVNKYGDSLPKNTRNGGRSTKRLSIDGLRRSLSLPRRKDSKREDEEPTSVEAVVAQAQQVSV
ncbi:hypothetical protein T439DRAFT_329133 [Meredithblackwellia eburnea MCA 4105]